MELPQRIAQRARERNNEWHIPKLGHYHASQIYDIVKGKIKPEDFFKKQEFDDDLLGIFEIGNMYHAFVSSLYPKEAQDLPIEIDLGEGAKIVGRMDLFLNDHPIELKTCSAIPSKPLEYNKYQLQCYIQATNKDHGWLTYIEKGKKWVTRDYKVLRDDILFEEIKEKVVIFHHQLLALQGNETGVHEEIKKPKK